MTMPLRDTGNARSDTTTTDTPPICAADPGSVIWHFFAHSATPISAREALFLWIMSLPDHMPARQAARDLLKAYTDWLRDAATARQEEMVELLRQVIHSPIPAPTRRNAQRWSSAGALH